MIGGRMLLLLLGLLVVGTAIRAQGEEEEEEPIYEEEPTEDDGEEEHFDDEEPTEDDIHLGFAVNCGDKFKAGKISLKITSPNYPSNYPRNAYCTYTITAPEGKQIKIEFTDMNVEHHIRCIYDSVSIRQEKKKVAKICGTAKPTFTIKGSKADIIFKSDGIGNKKGFSAKVTAV